MLEKMIRFFIISINEGSGFKGFNMFRNIERITDFLTTLISCYKKSREKLKILIEREYSSSSSINEILQKVQSSQDFFISPNESEFFSYILLFTSDKPLDMEKNLGILGNSETDEIRNTFDVKIAIFYKF